MRTFKQIYSELKHYGAFKAEPSTQSEAIKSMSCFINEMIDGDDLGEMSETSKRFLVLSYNFTAEQYILNWNTDTRTFKQLLKASYENLSNKAVA
jgi:predicted transcriptional regulator